MVKKISQNIPALWALHSTLSRFKHYSKCIACYTHMLLCLRNKTRISVQIPYILHIAWVINIVYNKIGNRWPMYMLLKCYLQPRCYIMWPVRFELYRCVLWLTLINGHPEGFNRLRQRQNGRRVAYDIFLFSYTGSVDMYRIHTSWSVCLQMANLPMDTISQTTF